MADISHRIILFHSAYCHSCTIFVLCLRGIDWIVYSLVEITSDETDAATLTKGYIKTGEIDIYRATMILPMLKIKIF